jgi:outer membrane protein assembly factor BamB
MRSVNHPTIWAPALLAACVALGGCGQEPFSINFPRNDPGALRSVTRRASTAVPTLRNGIGRPIVFLVATQPRGIVAYDVEAGKVLWRKDISDSSSKIVVGRNLIFHRKGSTILQARRIRTGEIAWQYTLQYGNSTEFFGMDADGDDLYYVATNMTGSRAFAQFSDVTKVDGSGKVVWTRRAPGPLGAPAVRNGLVFLPFRFQYLSVLDGRSGNEKARIYVRHEVAYKGRAAQLSPVLINYAWSMPDGLYYGNDMLGVFRLSDKTRSGLKTESDFATVPLEQLRSVNSRYFWDAYKPSMVAYTAIDRNRMLWRWAKDGQGFSHGVAVLQFYRYFFGFEAQSGTLRWAYMHPATEVISSAHLGDRIVFVSREGKLVQLDVRTGEKIWEQDTGIRTHGATFDVEGFAPPAQASGGKHDLVETLKDIIREPDLQFQDAKVFAVSQLVKVPGAEISRILLGIVNSANTPVAVRRAAGKVLVDRASADSLDIFLEALKTRYDYLQGSHPQGVGMIAKALARIKSPRAVPLLLEHLNEPLTPFSALEELVQALIDMGDPRIVWPFGQFLLTYRAEAGFMSHINILTTMARALLRMGGKQERQMLTFLAEDHHTLPQLRHFLRKELGKAAR